MYIFFWLHSKSIPAKTIPRTIETSEHRLRSADQIIYLTICAAPGNDYAGDNMGPMRQIVISS
jgi:hypothetical protein